MIIGISGKIGSGKDTVANMIRFIITNKIRVQRGASPVTYENFMSIGLFNWDESGFYTKKFASKLKQMVSMLTGIPVEDLEHQSIKDSYLGEEWDYYHIHDNKKVWHSMTVRDLLQRFGTNAVRDKVHANSWVNALFADYNLKSIIIDGKKPSEKRYPNWLIPDVRFPNEADAIVARGGIILRVDRPFTLIEDPTLEEYANRDIYKLYEDGSEALVEDELDLLDPEVVYAIQREYNSHYSETALDEYSFAYTIDNLRGIPELLKQVEQFLQTIKLI